MRVCVHVRAPVYARASAYVCVGGGGCVRARLFVPVLAPVCACVCARVRMRACACACACVCMVCAGLPSSGTTWNKR